MGINTKLNGFDVERLVSKASFKPEQVSGYDITSGAWQEEARVRQPEHQSRAAAVHEKRSVADYGQCL